MQAVKLMSPDELIGYLTTQGVNMDQEEEEYLKRQNIGGNAFVRCMTDRVLGQHLRSNLRLGTVSTMMYSSESLRDRAYSH